MSITRKEAALIVFDRRLVGHIRDDRVQRNAKPLPLQRLHQKVDRLLAVSQEEELPGLVSNDLPHDFAADGTARPRHEDAAAPEIAGDRLQVDRHGVSPQKVLQLDYKYNG